MIFEGVRGETAALAAAFLWAMATILFGRAGKKISPIELNLVKNIIAIACIVLTLFVTGGLIAAVDPLALLLLALSGVVGIGIGDTAYFEALNRLGARRTLLLLMLSPPMAALVAQLALGETLGIAAWSGILLTVSGVAWVVTERYAGPGTRVDVRGLTIGTIAVLAQAVGVVFARAAMTHTAVTPLWAALVRLSAGVVLLLVWIMVKPAQTGYFKSGRYKTVWWIIIFAPFIGTYLAIWLQQISLKYTNAGVAQTLLSTSPLFVLPLAVWMGEKVSLRAIAGVLLALFGIAMLFGLFF
jgi:drug/metabolite transporter (DMT)-like permease